MNVLIGLLGAVGALDTWCGMIIKTGTSTIALAAGGLGWFSFIARVLFAAICVCLGILILKGYKVLSTTETSFEKVIDLGSEVEQPIEDEEVVEEVEQPALEPAQ